MHIRVPTIFLVKGANPKGAGGVLGLKVHLGQVGVVLTVQCYTFQEILACVISLHACTGKLSSAYAL